jgi:hypothetical protein
VWIFFIFWPSKICVSPIDVISFLFCPSGRRHHAVVLCHTSFPYSQNKLVTSSSFSDNALSRCISPWVKIKTLNPHHHCRPSYLDRPTPTLHCYKKFTPTMPTLSTTQSLSLFFILPNQSTTSLELHPPPSFSFTVIPRSSFLRTITPTVIN